MHRFKNILLVHDGLESGHSTLTRAIELAAQNQASLTVIQVLDQIPSDYRMLITSLPPEEIMAIAIKKHTLLLEKYLAGFPGAAGVQPRVVAGREFIKIIQEVLRNNHDLVIKTARGMDETIGILFGTTAMHLLRKCPCPVWLVKPDSRPHFGRIMAAVDVTPPEVEENDLNRKIMELATSLALREKYELHIVHAWEKPNTSLFSGGLEYFAGDMDKLVNETKNIHIRWLDDFLESYDLQQVQHQEHVLEGWADKVIPEFAEQQEIDLIVMGTVSRTGIPGFFIGNTAEKILLKIHCSVLAVKPGDFVSPVRN